MKQWRTEKGTVIRRVLGGRSNAYLVSNDDRFLLIDTGRRASYRRLKKHLDKAGILPSSSLQLVLTHTHFDHVENAAALSRDFSVEILVHDAEAEFLEKGGSPLPKGTFFLSRVVMERVIYLLQALFRYESARAERTVAGTMNLEDCIPGVSLLPVPGHTAGSLAIIVDDEVAIVGDAMFGILPRSILPPFGDDLPLLKKSWERLHDTGCRLFLPGHGRAIGAERLQAAIAANK